MQNKMYGIVTYKNGNYVTINSADHVFRGVTLGNIGEGDIVSFTSDKEAGGTYQADEITIAATPNLTLQKRLDEISAKLDRLLDFELPEEFLNDFTGTDG